MGGSTPPIVRPPDPPTCPETLNATLTGPAPDIVPNSWLDVVLAGPSAVVVEPVTGDTVGSLAGISGLARLIRCIRDGVPYRAHVDSVRGGRVTVTVTRQQ